MHALVGIASLGPDANAQVNEGCRRLAVQAHVIALSRPWSAVAASGSQGLLRAVHVAVDLPHAEVRPWLWDLEGDGHDLQVELLAGRQHGLWRWGIDLDRDGAWMGPLADVVPDLHLPTGMTVHDHLLHHPHPGSLACADDVARTARPADALEAVHLGRTWETR